MRWTGFILGLLLVGQAALGGERIKPQDAQGRLAVEKIFGDHMVLQQGMELPVWGSAVPGEKVTVRFRGQEVSATADEKGRWFVKLSPMAASPNQQGGDLVVTAKEETIAIQDVLVGEVWLGSGQSNMASRTGQIDGDYVQIRLRTSDGRWKPASNADFPGFSSLMWHFGRNLHKELQVPVGLIVGAAGATSANRWVAEDALVDPKVRKLVEICNKRLPEYKKYFDEIKSRTKAESEVWDKLSVGFMKKHLPADTMENYPTSLGLQHAEHVALRRLLETVFEDKPEACDQWRAMWTDFVLKHDPEHVFLRSMALRGPCLEHPLGRLIYAEPPSLRLVTGRFSLPPFTTKVTGDAGDLYKMHIQPVVPLAIRGVLWDQGESGSGIGGVDQLTIMRVLIQSWRKAWAEAGGQSDFPWISIQKPSGGGCAFSYDNQPKDNRGRSAPFESEYPVAIPAPNTGLVGEYHNRLMTIPNTSIAISSDLGWGIHPHDKDRYGRRACRVALGFVYGRKIEYLGPVYDSHTPSGNKFVIKFKHVGQGLTARHAGAVQGFMIAGEDRKFVWARAEITDKDTVEVWSDKVAKPAAVRYAYARWYPWANLFNRDGLPALAFRTDDWAWPNMLPEYFEEDLYGIESTVLYWICDPEGSK